MVVYSIGNVVLVDFDNNPIEVVWGQVFWEIEVGLSGGASS
jgi:hypothetical protein